MATIPNTPDIAAALQTATVEAVKRLSQLHQLGSTEESRLTVLLAERDGLALELQQFKADYASLYSEWEKERAMVATLTSKLQSYESHPDVIKAKKDELEQRKLAIEAELENLK